MARILAALAVLSCVGCSLQQPYVTEERLARGLVIVLPGIEGPSLLNSGIRRGLADGGVDYALELYDWTSKWGPLHSLIDEPRNRGQAQEIVDRIAGYRREYPRNPVFLVGRSSGAAIAVWVAEALPAGEQLEGIVLLAASLSPQYPLAKALANSQRGIVSFRSELDVFFLMLGTTTLKAADRSRGPAAGRAGFRRPPAEGWPSEYDRLFEIVWTWRMIPTGHLGMHATSGKAGFVSTYVAPLIRSEVWDAETVARAANGRSRDHLQLEAGTQPTAGP